MAVNPKQRIVVSTPLIAVWNDDGDLSAERIRDLGVDDIKQMLRQGTARFVVANVGSPLDWIHESNRVVSQHSLPQIEQCPVEASV